MLKIYIDFKCPGSYLAMKPTIELIQKHKLQATWLPFKSSQQRIPEEKENEEKGELHRRVRAIERRNVHLMYAEALDTPMSFPEEIGITDLALSVLHTLTLPMNFIHAAFNAYWVDHRDLNDPDVVAALLKQAGYEAALPDIASIEKTIELVQQQALDENVVATPCYVIKEQVFLGREHLPWIEELATT